MRRDRASSSELGHLAAPLARAVDIAWRNVHWWIATMAVLYALSGITIVRPDEVALVLRWGRLVGDSPALQQHGAGLLFALPRPIDQVIRVPTKHVSEAKIHTLASVAKPAAPAAPAAESQEEEEEVPPTPTPSPSLDPLVEGYAVTGDNNVVQLDMIARYRVRDAALWQFYGPDAESILRAEVTAAMVRSLGEMGVDRVLSDGRKDLIALATRRAQAGLDAAHSGLELSSLELTQLGPPAVLAPDFAAVQTAFIDAETQKKDAQAYAAGAAQRASADVDRDLQAARATASTDIATATGEAAAFRALASEYRANPAVIRERLYRDAVEKGLSEATVRWVPPPTGGRYHGMRITLSRPGSQGGNTSEPEFP